MWYHYDRLGNVMDLTDENGNLSASYDQDAFSNVLSGSTSGYHLTTKEFSYSIALYYFYQRWYDPQLGRFIKKDVIKSQKLYLYCRNNPVNSIDPSGCHSFDECMDECLGLMPGGWKLIAGCSAVCLACLVFPPACLGCWFCTGFGAGVVVGCLLACIDHDHPPCEEDGGGSGDGGGGGWLDR